MLDFLPHTCHWTCSFAPWLADKGCQSSYEYSWVHAGCTHTDTHPTHKRLSLPANSHRDITHTHLRGTPIWLESYFNFLFPTLENILQVPSKRNNFITFFLWGALGWKYSLLIHQVWKRRPALFVLEQKEDHRCCLRVSCVLLRLWS